MASFFFFILLDCSFLKCLATDRVVGGNNGKIDKNAYIPTFCFEPAVYGCVADVEIPLRANLVLRGGPYKAL